MTGWWRTRVLAGRASAGAWAGGAGLRVFPGVKWSRTERLPGGRAGPRGPPPASGPAAPPAPGSAWAGARAPARSRGPPSAWPPESRCEPAAPKTRWGRGWGRVGPGRGRWAGLGAGPLGVPGGRGRGGRDHAVRLWAGLWGPRRGVMGGVAAVDRTVERTWGRGRGVAVAQVHAQHLLHAVLLFRARSTPDLSRAAPRPIPRPQDISILALTFPLCAHSWTSLFLC